MKTVQNKRVFYTLARFSAVTEAAKKATPKPIRTKNDSHGNGASRASARSVLLEWVSGRAYSSTFATSGIWVKEKKVPDKKVIGSSTTLLKVLMP